jgi:hypothetical protein
MDTRIAKLVSLTDKTLARREADTRAAMGEALEREARTTSPAFQAMWNQKYHGAKAMLEMIVAARQIKDWAR